MVQAEMSREAKFLSREFIAGLGVQLAIYLVLGGMAWGSVQSDLQQLKDKHVQQDANPEKIARIEEQLKNISSRQVEFKGDIKEIAAAVYELKAEIRKNEEKRGR